MSDPYGNNPSGQNPYGPPQPTPYGGSGGGGYGAPQGGYPGGFESQPPKTDGVSVASFILSLLCCTGLIGLILGFIGLKRTKGGQRKGRGFAIAGVVLGILSVLAGIAAGAFFVFFAQSLVTPGNAEVGQCVNVDEEDGSVLLYKKECNEEHDAEIVGITKVTSDNREEIENSMAGYCAKAIKPENLAKITEHLADVKAVIEDPKDVSTGDHLVCYVEPGSKLDEPLL